MERYEVMFYKKFSVDADSEDEALNEGESELRKAFESPHLGLTEMFDNKVIKEKCYKETRGVNVFREP